MCIDRKGQRKETHTCLEFTGVGQFGFELGVAFLTRAQLPLQPLHLLLQLPEGELGLIPLLSQGCARLLLLLQLGNFLPKEVHMHFFALQSFFLSL